MIYSLKKSWSFIKTVVPGDLLAEFRNLKATWDDHDSGFSKWTNLMATKATISNLTMNGNIVFVPTTDGIVGTTTNDNAVSGNVGQYIETGQVTGSFPTVGNHSDAGSITLTAGDWDVEIHTGMTNAQVTVAAMRIGISTTSGNSATGIIGGVNEVLCGAGANQNSSAAIPRYRLSLNATTIVYFKLFSDAWTTAAPTYTGQMSARRVR